MSRPEAHSPADILRHALVAKGAGVLRSQNTDDSAWPIYASHLPDKPDNAACVYDTAGTADGRIQATGETLRHPGFQIRVRAGKHRDAWMKARALQKVLDGIRQLVVVIGSDSYKLSSVTQTSDVLSLGQENDAARREQLTLNGTLTFVKQ